MAKKLVAVAVSGGVDSSTAALLLKKGGHEVIGLHMHLWYDVKPQPEKQDHQHKSEKAIDKAEQACHTLGIPLHIVNLENEFESLVVDYFCHGYMGGQTPNPCIICNRYLKFGLLLDKALSLGADYLATGHYARVNYFEGAYHLVKGADSSKDQSYVLYTLGQDKLRHILFPLGDYFKTEVRKIAQQNSLPAAKETGSQDICFIDGKYGDFLSRHITAKSAGKITNSQGKVLGQHNGIAFYTIGQRHGLGFSAGQRLFVVKIDPVKNIVIVGTEEELYSQNLIATEVNWVSGGPLDEPTDVTAKIRYKSPEVAATLYPKPDSAKIQFCKPQRAVTPGQAVVFYKDSEVVGGGTIEKQE